MVDTGGGGDTSLHISRTVRKELAILDIRKGIKTTEHSY